MVENKLEDVNISNENKVNPISSFIAKYILLPAKIVSLAACGSNGDDPEYKTIAQGSLDTGDYKGFSYEIKIGKDPNVKEFKIVGVIEQERNRRGGQFFFHPEVPKFIDDLFKNTNELIMYVSGPGIEEVNGNKTFNFDSYYVSKSIVDGKTYDNITGHPASRANNYGLNPLAGNVFKHADLDNLVGIYNPPKE